MDTTLNSLGATQVIPATLAPAAGYLQLINISPEDWSAVIDTRRKLIGRSRQADIRIPSDMLHVSRKHAFVWSDAKKVMWIQDEASRGGTRLNGVWIESGRPVRLVHNDRISLGDVELIVQARLTATVCRRPEPRLPSDSSDHSMSGESLLCSSSSLRQKVRRLTPAELDVVLWMCRGIYQDSSLGVVLGRSPNTVRTQVGAIFLKLDVNSRSELVGTFRQTDLTPAPAKPRIMNSRPH